MANARSDGVAAARANPSRFVQHDDLLAIDEIQRAPELMLAIKAAVDRDDRPGAFLLTGSARVLGLKALPDSLVGRMETVELWPFSQGELEGTASLPAQLLKVERLAGDAGIPARSAERYLSLFEEVFLFKRLPAWSNRSTPRAVRMKKVLFVDTGLCAHLQRRSVKRLLRDDALVGPLLENFVLGELARQLSWSTTSATLAHFRTRDGVEVDGVLESAEGRLVGVEVKASNTVRAEDFAGLRHFAAHARDRFHHGVVLYTGEAAVPFGDRLTAVPIEALWRS